MLPPFFTTRDKVRNMTYFKSFTLLSRNACFWNGKIDEMIPILYTTRDKVRNMTCLKRFTQEMYVFLECKNLMKC